MDNNTIDLFSNKTYTRAELQNAYYYLMISDWGDIIINDLISKFNPLKSPYAEGDNEQTYINIGTSEPIRYILDRIKDMKLGAINNPSVALD